MSEYALITLNTIEHADAYLKKQSAKLNMPELF